MFVFVIIFILVSFCEQSSLSEVRTAKKTYHPAARYHSRPYVQLRSSAEALKKQGFCAEIIGDMIGDTQSGKDASPNLTSGETGLRAF
jgi:hypothetical protein